MAGIEESTEQERIYDASLLIELKRQRRKSPEREIQRIEEMKRRARFTATQLILHIREGRVQEFNKLYYPKAREFGSYRGFLLTEKVDCQTLLEALVKRPDLAYLLKKMFPSSDSKEDPTSEYNLLEIIFRSRAQLTNPAVLDVAASNNNLAFLLHVLYARYRFKHLAAEDNFNYDYRPALRKIALDETLDKRERAKAFDEHSAFSRWAGYLF